VLAENFVVASGEIEATRLLLSIDDRHDGRIFRGCEALGRFFHDQISAPLADFVPNDRSRFNRSFGHRFIGTTIRNTRLELTAEAQTADGVASAYAHVAAETEPGSGFNYTGRRRSSSDFMSSSSKFPMLTTASNCRAAAMLWACALRPSIGAPARPRVRPSCLNMRRLDAFWRRHRMEQLAGIEWRTEPKEIDANFLSRVNAGDVFHPAGSTRMGTSGKDAVVDKNLRTFALTNLWVASTSVVPALGSANPTLTLMLLSSVSATIWLRLAIERSVVGLVNECVAAGSGAATDCIWVHARKCRAPTRLTKESHL
jgi:GMC oxidoreductase